LYYWIAAGIIALCLARWSQKADSESAGAIGNGFAQCSFGTQIFTYAEPGCLRPLFPLLIFPDGMAKSQEAYGRWYLYQTLRFLVLLAAFRINLSTSGLYHSLVLAAMFGLTLRYDYWSNGIELLAAVACFNHLPWGLCLGLGLVCGLGREVLPILALVGTWPAAALALGASLSTTVVRRLVRTDPKWHIAERDELQYGKWQWRTNLSLLRGWFPPAYLDIAVYTGIGILAVCSAPVLSIALLATTALVCRIDEPRVLTMLMPWAASTVIRWL